MICAPVASSWHRWSGHDTGTSRSALSIEHVCLGRAVRELRAGCDLSQEQLGFRSELHRNYVGSIERGEVNATFRTLLAVATGLEMPLSTIVRIYELRRAEQP